MFVLSLAVAAVAAAPMTASIQQVPKAAPYDAIRWEEDQPMVRVSGEWYALLAIDDHETDKLIAFCRDRYRDRWRKRFDEDLVEVLTGIGDPPGPTVRLTLRDAGGQTTTRDNVAMTEENRRAIMRLKYPDPPKTPQREASRRPSQAQDRSGRLSADQIGEDLAALKRHLESSYSYLTLRKHDYARAIDDAEKRLSGGASSEQFAVEVQRIIAGFGDGHSGVRELERYPPAGYTPFLIGEAGERTIAFREDRSGFLDDEYPFLTRIDGIELSRWIEAARAVVPQASPQFIRRETLRHLRMIGFLRQAMNLPARDAIAVELAAQDGRTRTIELPVSRRKPIYGAWPRRTHRELPGQIGYLRLASMDDDAPFLKDLRDAMQRFRDTRGLIIDVRGNGGGSRHALLALFPYVMSPDEPPVVANVAACRLTSGDDPHRAEGYLADRFLFPAAYQRWTPEERRAIERFAAGFKPQWTPPAGGFSDWHYLLLKRVAAGGATLYHYDRPVVILMNGDCFSATDIFLAAMKTRKNVTLLGTSSGGGSGRKRPYELAHSGIVVSLSSMASFRPDGTLYDGCGIEPDVVADAIPTDWLGKTDTQLDAAVERLGRAAASK